MPITYPVTITRQQLLDLDACEEGVRAFDEHATDGTLIVHDMKHQSALLAVLGRWEDWAVSSGLLLPVTLTGGYGSTLTGGDRSTLTGGYGSTLAWRYWDGKRGRLHAAYTGEGGIEAGVAYIGRFVEGKFIVKKA